MGEQRESQILFEQYVRGNTTLKEAADALEVLIKHRKATGGEVADLPIRKPKGWQPSEAESEGAEALFEEMNRRATVT